MPEKPRTAVRPQKQIRKEIVKMEFIHNENQIALYSEKGKLMETLAKDLEQRDLKTAPPALTL